MMIMTMVVLIIEWSVITHITVHRRNLNVDDDGDGGDHHHHDHQDVGDLEWSVVI